MLPDIVVFGIVPWTPRYQRPQQFVREFIRRGHRVVYVNPHALHEEEWREVEQGFAGQLLVVQMCTHDADSIHDADPWSWDDIARAHHTFRRMASDVRLRSPILFVQSPGWWQLVSWIVERTDLPVVYDCLDEHTGWHHEAADMVRAWEGELARASDLVLASSEALYRRLDGMARVTLLVPNGCDAAHFEAARVPSGALHPPLSRPIIGYYGAISATWFDVDLLCAVAELRPTWSVVLAGPADEECRRSLDRCPNVLLLGEVPYDVLPRYAADFDVATIPFLVNDLTDATDPVKLYEYFAAGKPVVATPMPELCPFQGLLTLAETAAGFVRGIERWLEQDDKIAERQAIATAADWNRRVDAFYEPMLELLPSLDVVIVTFNNADLTSRCVESIRKDPSYPAHVIVVDNASTDDTVALLDSLEGCEGVTVVRNQVNRGFAAAVNQAMHAGSGQYALLLNNDVVLPKGALLGFVDALMWNEAVGIVGPVTNSIGNEAEIYVAYDPDDHDDLTRFFLEVNERHHGEWFEIDVAALFAAAFRRTDFEGVGGLPERYLVGMFEDDEFAERMRQRGKRVVCREDLFVHHAGRAAFRRIDPLVYQAVFDRNRRVFEEAMDRPWETHRRRADLWQPRARGTF